MGALSSTTRHEPRPAAWEGSLSRQRRGGLVGVPGGEGRGELRTHAEAHREGMRHPGGARPALAESRTLTSPAQAHQQHSKAQASGTCRTSNVSFARFALLHTHESLGSRATLARAHVPCFLLVRFPSCPFRRLVCSTVSQPFVTHESHRHSNFKQTVFAHINRVYPCT